METHEINIAGNVTQIQTPDGFGALLVTAMAEQRNYPETVTNEDGEEIPNPQTKEEFCAMEILSFCRQIVAAHRVKVSRAAAQATAEAQNETDRAQIVVV